MGRNPRAALRRRLRRRLRDRYRRRRPRCHYSRYRWQQPRLGCKPPADTRNTYQIEPTNVAATAVTAAAEVTGVSR
jgi:hypothetical protein